MALENLSISKLSQRNQLLLLTLVVFGLCYVFYLYYIQPLKVEVETLETDVQGLRSEIQKGQIIYSRLPQFKREVEDQQATLANLRGVLPEQKQTDAILSAIVQLARESRLQIKSFTPQSTIRKEFYEDWPILLAMEGNYDNLGQFFDKVSQFTRIINVDSISITKLDKPERNKTISATCTATTFVFVEPGAITKAEEEKPGPGKKKAARTPRVQPKKRAVGA
jgi:type IV pilus assembly protein PilO